MNRVVFLFTDAELNDADMPFQAWLCSKYADDDYTVEPVDTTDLCYHRNRRTTVDLFSTTAVTTLRCLDCGATASAGYQAPLPDLPPMPFPAAALDESNEAAS